MPIQSPLTPSEIVLVHGASFASLKRPIATAMIPLALLLILPVLAFRGRTDAVGGWASRSWSHVEGQIVAAQVTAPPDHKPVVRYAYEVGNRSYTGETIWFGMRDKSFDAASAAAVAARYPAGGPVTVTYNPDDPGSSVLEPGVRFDAYSMILFYLFWMLLALIWLAIQLPLLFQPSSPR